MNDARQNSRNGILSLTIKDKAVLYSAYMPFLENGGLFVPTNKAYALGDEVFTPRLGSSIGTGRSERTCSAASANSPASCF